MICDPSNDAGARSQKEALQLEIDKARTVNSALAIELVRLKAKLEVLNQYVVMLAATHSHLVSDAIWEAAKK